MFTHTIDFFEFRSVYAGTALNHHHSLTHSLRSVYIVSPIFYMGGIYYHLPPSDTPVNQSPLLDAYRAIPTDVSIPLVKLTGGRELVRSPVIVYHSDIFWYLSLGRFVCAGYCRIASLPSMRRLPRNWQFSCQPNPAPPRG